MALGSSCSDSSLSSLCRFYGVRSNSCITVARHFSRLDACAGNDGFFLRSRIHCCKPLGAVPLWSTSGPIYIGHFGGGGFLDDYLGTSRLDFVDSANRIPGSDGPVCSQPQLLRFY